MKTHQITSHDMTWHLATNHITSPRVTSQPTALLHRSLQPTTSKQVTTSPPWNGWRLVHSNNSVWASQSLVTLCTFYRQILSLTYSFSSWKLPPPACPALLVYIHYSVKNGRGITWGPAKKITWGPAHKVVHLKTRKKDHFHTRTHWYKGGGGWGGLVGWYKGMGWAGTREEEVGGEGWWWVGRGGWGRWGLLQGTTR